MPQPPNTTTTTKAASPKAARFTIINAKTRTVFIQQPIEKIADANVRLEQCNAKFAKVYDLAIVRLDDKGGFVDLEKDEQGRFLDVEKTDKA